jgi:hypothetical protein
MMVPMLIVLAYIFDLQLVTSPTIIIAIAAVVTLIYFIVGLLFLIFKKEQLKRKLKPTYIKEFSTLFIINALGVLGIGVMFIYLGGPDQYVPHVIIPLFLGTYMLIFIAGDRFFNINLLRK